MDFLSYFSRNVLLKTERLIIRKILPQDADDMYEYACKSDTCRYLLWEPHRSPSHTAEYIKYIQKEYAQGRYFDCAVVLKESGKMIGTVGFAAYDDVNSVAEVGYVINSDYHGNGYATEALGAIINFAFCELNVNRVEARYIKQNTASLNVMERCEMKKEGVQRQKMFIKGLYRDIGICSILRDEYFLIKRESIYRAKEEKSGLLGLFYKN